MRRFSLVCLALTIILACTNAKVLHMKTTRQPADLEKRATVSATIKNVHTNYVVNATCGTPPQHLQFFLDTGSGDVWTISPNACSSASGCPDAVFDGSSSSTFETLEKDSFSILYMDGTGATGNTISDTLSIAGATINDLSMGYATQVNGNSMGIMGLSPGNSKMIEAMYEQQQISSRTFSIWMDGAEKSTGNLLFGGYDDAKFEGDLGMLNILPDSDGEISAYNVAWTSMSISTGGETTRLTTDNFRAPVLLDSGTTVTTLPYDIYSELMNTLGGVVRHTTEGDIFPCPDADTSISYQFGGSTGPTITVPYSQLFRAVTDDNDDAIIFPDGAAACNMGIGVSRQDGHNIFGDTFMRSAYVLYNLDSNVIGLAQTTFHSTETNIIEITADNDGNQQNGGDDYAATASAATTVSIPSVTANPRGPAQTTTLDVTDADVTWTPSMLPSGFKTSVRASTSVSVVVAAAPTDNAVQTNSNSVNTDGSETTSSQPQLTDPTPTPIPSPTPKTNARPGLLSGSMPGDWQPSVDGLIRSHGRHGGRDRGRGRKHS